MTTSNGNRNGRVSLSTASPYEQMFKTRHRGRGRPDGDVQPIFVAEGVDPVLVSVAKRRAYAVVHQEQRERMREIFEAELKVLRRRGTDVVLADTGRRSLVTSAASSVGEAEAE